VGKIFPVPQVHLLCMDSTSSLPLSSMDGLSQLFATNLFHPGLTKSTVVWKLRRLITFSQRWNKNDGPRGPWAASGQNLPSASKHFQACLVVCGFHFFPFIAADEWSESIVCNQFYYTLA
jgi:hypothetical protein